MDRHRISRRSLVAGLGAAIPAATVAAIPALAGTDPIFAAIEAHKADWDAYGDTLSAASDIEEALSMVGSPDLAHEKASASDTGVS